MWFLKAVKDLQGELGQWSKNERLNRFKEQFGEIMEKQAGIGIKGQNNLLRDCGFYDHIPIDIHERRFLLRTGIFHKYASLDKSDPEDDEDLAKAFANFCKKELNTLQVEGVLLSDAPGLVDLIIWYFSQEKTEKQNSLAICAKNPQCGKCPLKLICLFAQSVAVRGV